MVLSITYTTQSTWRHEMSEKKIDPKNPSTSPKLDAGKSQAEESRTSQRLASRKVARRVSRKVAKKAV